MSKQTDTLQNLYIINCISYLTVSYPKIIKLLGGHSSWVSTSVSPGGHGICCSLLSSQQVHCTDLLFWALGMKAQWYSCTGS